ncbi:hypothetical protein B0O80DRAFT_527515 [Mortierella sp. GBAus27b]|nr:hypothetical protein B0O80DRAFT_527515 [Mortierella sp. GBAus27b]
MSATVSLIDPTTLNPSSQGNSRLARPPVFITRTDQQTSADLLEALLSDAKAYRLQMLALSKSAANFGYALEKIAHSKAAIRDSSNISSSLQAAAGLHYLISNHHQVLGDTVYKQFMIPLLQQLDTYKANMESSEAQYERSMKEMSQKIKETEAASMENGRKRQRDLLQFRQFLSTLAMQVDELEHMKLGYYFSNLEAEQAQLQMILQKTSTVVRAQVELYERLASKGLNDALLAPMTTQGPDPYCSNPTKTELPSIFSATVAIPTPKAGGAGTNTSPYGTSMPDLHSTTSRKLHHITSRDRLLFGDTSSIASRDSMVRLASAASAMANSSKMVSTSAPPYDQVVGEPDNSQNESEASLEREPRDPEEAASVPQPFNSSHSAGEHQEPSSTNMAPNEIHLSSNSSERGSLARASLLGSRPESRSNLELASHPTETSIHIPQDSELLRNSDFTYSCEPSDELEHQSHHGRLDLSRHEAYAFGGFDDVDGGLHRPISSSSLHLRHSRAASHQLHGLGHRSSDGQLSNSAASHSGASSTHSASSDHILHHRSASRASTDADTAIIGTSLDDPFYTSMVKQTDLRAAFDGGMPAFYADEVEDLQVQPSSQSRRQSLGSGSVQGSRPQSRCEQDQELKTLQGSKRASMESLSVVA